MSSWPPWFQSRLPAPSECSPAQLIMERAGHAPDAVFVVFEDGTSWSNRRMIDEITQTASRLLTLGVRRGEHVALWLPNGPDLLRHLFAAWGLGLTPVLLNVALRGHPLVHALTIAQAQVLICHPRLVPRLDEHTDGLPAFRIIVQSGASETVPDTQRSVLSESSLPVDDAADSFDLRHPWDTAAILFSSGTTGAAKAVIVPFGQLWTLGRASYGVLTSADRMLLMYPLFHVAALGALFGTLSVGGTFALTESFRAANFFEVVRRTRSTSIPGLGRTFIDVLNKLPARANDADNPLRIVPVQSVNSAEKDFAARFACEVYAFYSMTETSCICIGTPTAPKDSSMGRPRSGIDLRIVDEFDMPVPQGQPGEIVVRADLPWVLNQGYFDNAHDTTTAWRNGWFHTGDIARQDAEGYLYYLDRSKDVIRRRSENISSVEIEAVVRRFPNIGNAAAIGVDTEGGEEVLLVVSLLGDVALDPASLIRYLIERLPHFMIPRFVRVVPALPLTNTNRVQKKELREIGLTPDCWDREAAGIRVKRERL